MQEPRISHTNDSAMLPSPHPWQKPVNLSFLARECGAIVPMNGCAG